MSYMHEGLSSEQKEAPSRVSIFIKAPDKIHLTWGLREEGTLEE